MGPFRARPHPRCLSLHHLKPVGLQVHDGDALPPQTGNVRVPKPIPRQGTPYHRSVLGPPLLPWRFLVEQRRHGPTYLDHPASHGTHPARMLAGGLPSQARTGHPTATTILFPRTIHDAERPIRRFPLFLRT
jgi:hypothetical protein